MTFKDKVTAFIGIPFLAYFRDLDLDSSFKPSYLKRLWYEFQDWR